MTDRKADAADAARGLTGALDRMSEQLIAVRTGSEERDAVLTEYGRRNRRLIYWTIISVVLDIVLTVALAVVAVQAHHAGTAATAASTRVAHVSASNFALCEAGNTARRQQVQLWNFVLGISGDHKQTAQQRRNIAEFRRHLEALFAPRDCAALGAKTH